MFMRVRLNKLISAQRNKLTSAPAEWRPPPEKLATSLAALRSLQERGVVAVRAADDLARAHRRAARQERLPAAGDEGDGYIAGSPDEGAGDSTA